MDREKLDSDERPMSAETTPEALGELAMHDVELVDESSLDAEAHLKTWEQLEQTHSQDQIAMLRKLGKQGPGAFKRVKSAEAAPAGLMKSNLDRFKPRRSQ